MIDEVEECDDVTDDEPLFHVLFKGELMGVNGS